MKSHGNISQPELAKVVGMSQTMVSRWCNGKNRPGLPQALILARFFGVPLEYLADDAMEEPPRSGLSPEAQRVLDAAAVVGYDVALRRIMVAPEVRILPPHGGEQGGAGGTKLSGA